MSNRRPLRDRRRVLKPSVVAFSPLSLSPSAWYRADLGITVATGVSEWQDQSGNGYHLSQGTAAYQPVYDADDANLNNRPSVNFDGSNDLLTSAATLSQVATASAFDWYAAVYITGIGTNTFWYGNDAIIAESGGFAAMALHSTTPTVQAGAWDGAAKVDSSTVELATATVVAGRLSGGSLYTRVDAGAWSAGSACGNISTLTGTMRVGANYNGAAFSQISVAELVLFNSVLSAANSTALMNYLVARYT